MKNFILLIIFAVFGLGSYAQCANPERVDEKTIQQLTNPFQLTFLNPVPKNLTDSTLIELMKPTKNLVDYKAMLEHLAKSQSKEAFQFFYAMLLFRADCVDDMTQMIEVASTVVYYQGVELLDRYFLDGKVQMRFPPNANPEYPYTYKAEVMREAAARIPEMYFCLQRNQEYTREQMQKIIDAAFNEYIPCESPIPVTKDNIFEVHNPYEFTFLHKAPQNLTDSCILRFMVGPFDADVKPMLERMAASKSHETYLLLHACICVMNDYDLYTNQFHSIANQLIIWGAMEWMNEYYWNHAVKKSDNWFVYRQDIWEYNQKQNPEMFYCNQLTEKELYDDYTKDLNMKNYDRAIVKIIKQHSNTHKSGFVSKIEEEVRQLPFVYDVNWERCFERNCIYPAYYDLTVKMYIDNCLVERNYSMNGAEFKYLGLSWKGKHYCGHSFETNDHKLVVKGIAFSPGFMDQSRAYCLKKEQERQERQENP